VIGTKSRDSGAPARSLKLPFATGGSVVEYGMGLTFFGSLVGIGVLCATLLPDWMVYPVGGAGALWVLGLLFFPFSFARMRATDIVLDGDGVRRSGSGKPAVAWARLQVLARHKREQDDWTNAPFECAVGDDQAPFVATEASDPAEILSLEELCRTLERLRDTDPGVPGRHEQARTIYCNRCGAPVAPSLLVASVCRFCDLPVQMPNEVRALAAAARDASLTRARTKAQLSVLLRWPEARRVNWLIGLCVLPAALTWPIAGGLFDEAFQFRGSGGPWHGVWLGISAGLLTAALLSVAHAMTAIRKSIPLLCRRFASVAAKDRPELHFCHGCGGTLPEVGESPFVVCAYCGSDNILAFDLPAYMQIEEAQSEALEAIVDRTAQTRKRWLTVARACGAASIVGGYGLWLALRWLGWW
jgi:hypothetical protein